MSAKIMGGVWDLQLSPAKQIVLLAYADHADHLGNNVRPSVGLMAWKTGYSERQIRRITKDLVKDCLLIVVKQRKGLTTNYKINLSAGIKKEPYRLDPGQNVLSTPDIAMSPHPGHSYVLSTPDMGVPEIADEPSIKPSLNPKGRKPDAFYDAIKAVWKYEGAMNGLMKKMLSGVADKAGWKEYNVTPAVTPDELLSWSKWYRRTHLHNNPSLNMLEERAKIQSSIYQYRQLPQASTELPNLAPNQEAPDLEDFIVIGKQHD